MSIQAYGAHAGDKPLEAMTITRRVSGFKTGDLVGVGCIVDSCKQCAECGDGLDAPGHTLGGYSQQIVVHERYVLRIRHDEDQLAAVAPLLCAGITTWSPLRH